MMSSFAAMLASPAPTPFVVATQVTDTASASSSVDPPQSKKLKIGFYKDTKDKLKATAALDAATILKHLETVDRMMGTEDKLSGIIADLLAAASARRAALPAIADRLHGSTLDPETMAKLKGKLWRLDLIPGHNRELTVGLLHHLKCTITAFTDETAQLIYSPSPSPSSGR
jgi:hypothetical protein